VKVAFWLLALFFFAVAVTLGARYNTGYVLVVSPPYRIELSLNLLVAVLLALLFIAYFAVRLVVIASRLPAEVSDFRARQRREKAHAAMMDGLRAFLEGRYAKAERACAAALEMEQSSAMAAINATIAARSAHELRRYSHRDEFIDKAESSAPDEITLRLMTHAELLLDEHRPEEALSLLGALRTTTATRHRQHTAALRLELKAQQLSRDWVAVLDLLQQLERRNALDMSLIRQWRRHAHLEGFKSTTHDAQALKEYWQNISPSDKKDSKLAAAAARAYAALGDYAAAHHVIEQSLDDQWDSELAQLYGECVENDVIRQIERAEAWLKSHPNDAPLLLALGKLCAHCELWGKAQNYLEASLSVEPSYTAHLALAGLYEKIGRPEPAKDHYQRGLELALRRLESD
jgi:HemY protein